MIPYVTSALVEALVACWQSFSELHLKHTSVSGAEQKFISLVFPSPPECTFGAGRDTKSYRLGFLFSVFHATGSSIYSRIRQEEICVERYDRYDEKLA